MEVGTPDRGGHRLGDFDATADTPVDYYRAINQLLRSSRRAPAKASAAVLPKDRAEETEMESYDTKQARGFSKSSKASNEAASEPGRTQQEPTTSHSPLTVNASTPSIPYSQPRGAKRPASPSLAQSGFSKRQQINPNSPIMLSPSRPLSSGPVDTLFGMNMDKKNGEMISQRQRRLFSESRSLDGDFHHSNVCENGPTSVNGDGGYNRFREVWLDSHRRNSSRELPTPAREVQHQERPYWQQQDQRSPRRLDTSQASPLQTDHTVRQVNMRVLQDSRRYSRAVSIPSRHDEYQTHRYVDQEDRDVEDADRVVSITMARAASMMRESRRAQSRPPHRGATVPPESFQHKPLYEQVNIRNGSQLMKDGTRAQQQLAQKADVDNSNDDSMARNRVTPRPASRCQKSRTPTAPLHFDLLEDSTEDELEERDMKSFFRRPNRNPPQQYPQGRSPYRRTQTAVPELPQLYQTPCRAKTPKSIKSQAESDHFSVKQPPQLQSPIWGPGTERRVFGSMPGTCPASKTLHRYTSQELRRNRSKSAGPHDAEGRGRNRSVASHRGRDDQQGESRNVVTPSLTQDERRGRSRSMAPRTPVNTRVREQSQYGGPHNIIARSQAPASEHSAIAISRPHSRDHQDKTRLSRIDEGSVTKVSNALKAMQNVPSTSSGIPEPKTPFQSPRNVNMLDEDSPAIFHTPLDVLIRKTHQQPQRSPTIPQVAENQVKVSRVLPSGSAFAKRVKSVEPKTELFSPVTPRNRPNSGRGLAAPEVIDLTTPDAVLRSIPMSKRLSPAAKKPAPKKTATPSVKSAKVSKHPAPPPKRVAKEKPAPVDTEELRQKKIAGVIIEKKAKSDETSLDIALFGQVVLDQEAEDRKAEEARAKGQREREAKMAAILAKEEAAKKAAVEELAKKKEEAEKRRREKELEEEQKRFKREADRQRQLAHENREKDLLRKAAEEKIKAERERKAKEEQLKQLKKQKAKEKAESVQAEAEDLAKLKAKKEQAKLQAASLSAAKLTPIVNPQPSEKQDAQMEDEDSLFMPEAPPVVSENTKPETRRGTEANESSNFVQASYMSSYRVRKEAEDLRKKLEQSQQLKERLDTRINRSANAVAKSSTPAQQLKASVSELQSGPVSAPAPQPTVASRHAPIVETLKAASQASNDPEQEPEPVSEKIKPIALPAKGNLPIPKPKVIPAPKATTTRDRIAECRQSRSSSSSNEVTPPPGLLDRIAASNIFKGKPKDSLSLDRPISNLSGPQSREQKPQTLLISDLEREELEKNQKKKGLRVRDYRLTDERKQKEANKRTELAKERKIKAIREEAKKNGTQISEEELSLHVEAFMEKRAQELQKRAENKARKEQEHDSGHDFGINPLNAEPLTAAQKLIRDAEANNGLSPEDIQAIQKQRDEQIARAEYGKIRNNAFDRASARTTVNDFTDSEESEEDPDPDPEPVLESTSVSEDSTQPPSTGNGEAEDSSSYEMSSDSESEEGLEEMSRISKMSELEIEPRNKHLKALEKRLLEPECMVMQYQVWKCEIVRDNHPEAEDKTARHKVKDFWSLADANKFALDLASDLAFNTKREYAFVDFRCRFKKGKYEGFILHTDTHESQFFVRAIPVGPSEFSPEFIAGIPKRYPEKLWDVMQFTSKRTVNQAAGTVIVQHDKPKFHGRFTLLEMANHEACEKLITMLKPAGANIDHITAFQNGSAGARSLRDQCNADGECFRADIDKDGIPDWMGYDKISMVVEEVKLQGPLN